ncbi:MAG TPA: hypothetical protein VE869_12035 [Gemmatimonas sp.]|nr:hypothetical protein [Gemmatimonas sp.]
MTLPRFPDHTRAGVQSRSRTFARKRLILGITAVGTAVVGAVCILLVDLPGILLSTSREQPWWLAVTTIALAMCVPLVAASPFDLVGGAVLVRRPPRAGQWFAAWARAAVTQLAVWTGVACVLLGAARIGGAVVAIGAFAVLQLLLASARGAIAGSAASFSRVGSAGASERIAQAASGASIEVPRVRVVESGDEAFSGGWLGLWPSTLVVPASWLQKPLPWLQAALVRRVVAARSGAHTRGVLLAVAWNTFGFALVQLTVSGDVGTAAGIVRTAAGMTVWTFLAVLLLPTPSRWAVFAVDAEASRGTEASAIADVIEQTDRWQDDEPARRKAVETIFHPVPARDERMRRLATAAKAPPLRFAAYSVARHALYLSWGGLSLVSRAVHCNVGRPALLVMLPSD